jgi:hypothetical protein
MSQAQIPEAEIMVSEIQSKLASKDGNQATPEMILTPTHSVLEQDSSLPKLII